MRTITSNKNKQNPFVVAAIFFLLFAVIPQITFAQYRITGMEDAKGAGVTSVILAKLKEPGKPELNDVRVQFNPNLSYASGTVFITSADARIALAYKGQLIVVEPNSSVEVKVFPKGSSVKSWFGKLTAKLKAVKASLGFFKVGNGFVWAHAEGTVFSIESSPNSKSAKFSTQDNSIINILDPYDCNVFGRSEDARNLTLYKAQQLNSNGQYSSGDLPPVDYSYEDAINYMLKRINNKLDSGSYEVIEELADDYIVLAELYIDGENYSKGIEKATSAREIYEEWEPDSQDYYYASLLLADALVESGDLEAGKRLASKLLPVFLDELNYVYDDCHGQDVNDDLGWVYDVLGRYYDKTDQIEKSEFHDEKADYYDEQGDKYECLD